MFQESKSDNGIEREQRENMRPSISVIMPLYNAARFLEETLTSVSNQVFQNYELLCINDGSDDDTVDIVKKFQDNDCRIKLFNNNGHMGAAIARNRGIMEARGEYLIFLDGDDICDEELLLMAYQKANDTDADIVMSESMHVTSEHIYDKKQTVHSGEYITKFCQQTVSVRDIKTCDFLGWPANPHTKLYRKEFIVQERLEFQNLSCENDTYFVMMAFFLAKRIVRLDVGRVMLYVRDHDTPSRISSERDPMCIYHAMSKVRDELEKRGIFDLLSKMYYYKTFFFLADALRGAKSKGSREKFYDFLVNEGFDKLFDGHDRKYGIDQYIQEKKQSFIKKGLGEGWERQFSYYDVFLKDNLQEISSIFQMTDGKTRRVGVWGTGENGRRFLAFCRKYALPVHVVVDRDESKYGSYCEGYPIQLPQAVRGVETVISTPNLGYKAVKELAQKYKKNIEVIDLNSYICWV